MVTEIDAEPVATPLPEPVGPEPEAVDELVEECIRDLDRLGVQPDAGAPTARKALRESGRHYGNDTIASAVKARKSLLSGTATTP